ncbi:hypothetical protein BC835DRAFT_1263177, partial [Cytidiella melzeri]
FGLRDVEDCLFAVFLGPPAGNATWAVVPIGVREIMAKTKRLLRFPKKSNLRGVFKTVAVGLSYGGGQMRPGSLRHSRRNRKILNLLMQDPNMQRVLGYGNSAFKFYFPKVFDEYAKNMDALLEHHTEFERPIANSEFAATSLNFGPSVITYQHTDSGNKANRLCPIFCTGDFDSRKGGHLVLGDLKLLVQFLPGLLALIPLATLRHGNASIQPGKQCESFTQYAADGLFRWVAYGFQSWKMLCKNPEMLAREWEQRNTRWVVAVGMFSKVSLLHEDCMCYVV